MPRTISARLITLCGCSQYRTIESPAPRVIEIPITQEGTFEMTTRRFRLHALNPPDVAVEADYVEVAE